jgi:hypothetical protein
MLIVALGSGIGLARMRGPEGALRVAFVLGALALAFHLLELLAT